MVSSAEETGARKKRAAGMRPGEGARQIFTFLPVLFLILATAEIFKVNPVFTLIAVLWAGSSHAVYLFCPPRAGRYIYGATVVLGTHLLINLSFYRGESIFSFKWLALFFQEMASPVLHLLNADHVIEVLSPSTGGFLILMTAIVGWFLLYGRFFLGRGAAYLCCGSLLICGILALGYPQAGIYLGLFVISVMAGFPLEKISADRPQRMRGRTGFMDKLWNVKLGIAFPALVIALLLAAFLMWIWLPPAAEWWPGLVEASKKGLLVFYANDYTVQADRYPGGRALWIAGEIILLAGLGLFLVKSERRVSPIYLSIPVFAAVVFILRGIYNGGYLAEQPLQILLMTLKISVYILLLSIFLKWRPQLALLIAIVFFFLPVLFMPGTSEGGISRRLNEMWTGMGVSLSDLFNKEANESVIGDDREGFPGFALENPDGSKMLDAGVFNDDEEEKVVFIIESETPFYWRQSAYHLYTGEGWEKEGVGRKRFSAGDLLPAEVAVAGPSFEVRIAVRAVLKSSTLIYPGFIKLIDAPPGLRFRYDDLGTVTLKKKLVPGERVEMTCVVPDVTPAFLSSCMADYPREIRNRYLQLPDNLPDEIITLTTDIISGFDNAYDRANALEEYLKTNYRYEDEPAPPPPGDDPIRHFLFVSRGGKCDDFAGAMVVMARIAGIPARMAVGFSPGLHFEEYYFITSANGHAWAELYFPGAGWIAFEPTAPGGGYELAIHPEEVAGFPELLSADYGDEEGIALSPEEVVGLLQHLGIRFEGEARQNGEGSADIEIALPGGGQVETDEERTPPNSSGDEDNATRTETDKEQPASPDGRPQKSFADWLADHIYIIIIIAGVVAALLLIFIAPAIPALMRRSIKAISGLFASLAAFGSRLLKRLISRLSAYLPVRVQDYMEHIGADPVRRQYYRQLRLFSRHLPRQRCETPREYLQRLSLCGIGEEVGIDEHELDVFRRLTADFEEARYREKG